MSARLAGRYGYPKDEPFKPGTFHPDKLGEPFHWKTPQKFFVVSMGDLFHEDVRQKIIADIFDIAYRAYVQYGHTFMFLTKRPQRMNDEILLWSAARGISIRAVDGFWLGVTAENQRTADERIPILLQIPAAQRFVSVEPMLEPINLRLGLPLAKSDIAGTIYSPRGGPFLDWVIAGPETGPRARPMSFDWIRLIANDCKAAGVPFFDKKDVLGETIQEWPRCFSKTIYTFGFTLQTENLR